ncbi:MAG: nucleoside triphosphate pyrophosphohydrolase [Candidatus Margulisbacteria bacterium]|nr:nucleoside triphosphate pyrophosphohydrolase [Candidatus Margulisiibacteriota bacterium]
MDLTEFVSIVKKLRSPEGCPWDKEQTFDSLRPHIIEEAYELTEAMIGTSSELLKEELGDVLLHVVMLANMAEENKWFSLQEVSNAAVEKLIRRHPHVFGDTTVTSVDEVWENWEKIKSQEKNNVGKSVLDSVPKSLPGLMEALKIQKKVARKGFDWENIADAVAKIDEEVAELKLLLSQSDSDSNRLEGEAGDVLFSMVNVFRKLGIDPEAALKNTNHKFKSRFQYIEKQAAEENRDVSNMSLEEMEAHWEAAKRNKQNR